MDCRALLITGGDYPIPECQLSLHQPTIKEIAMIGETDFFMGIQILAVNKMMFESGSFDFSNTNNFQIFMTIINQKETADKKEAVLQVLTLLLPNNKVSFTPRSMLVTGSEKIITIDDNNFDALQNAIIEIFALKNSANTQQYNPSDEAAKKIAEKLMKGRAKVAAEKSGNDGSIFVQYISILGIGLHIPLTELSNYTVFMVYDQMSRMGLQIESDIDIRARLAGANPQSQPENWMKNMY